MPSLGSRLPLRLCLLPAEGQRMGTARGLSVLWIWVCQTDIASVSLHISEAGLRSPEEHCDFRPPANLAGMLRSVRVMVALPFPQRAAELRNRGCSWPANMWSGSLISCINSAPCRREKASWGACVSWDLEVLSKFLKGLTRWFEEPFLSYLRSGFWGKARKNWMLPVTWWEAAMQPPSVHAHVQLSPAMGWSVAGDQAALPLGHSARERFGITLLLPPKSGVCEPPATSGRWRGGLRPRIAPPAAFAGGNDASFALLLRTGWV